MVTKFLGTRGKLDVAYDTDHDVLTIEGINYSGEFFRQLGVHGLAVGRTVRILSRDDGLVTLQTVEEDLPSEPLPLAGETASEDIS